MKRKRIAVLLHGGIGTGHFAQGYPMLDRLIEGLSTHFDITVFSQWSAQPDYQPSHFKFRAPSHKTSGGILRWYVAMRYLWVEHRKKPFEHLLAFWGFPAGFFLTVLSKLFGIPCTICLMGGDATGIASIKFGILHRRMLRPFALWAYRKANNLIALTEYQAYVVRQYGIQRDIISIPWGTAPGMFNYSPKSLSEVLHCLHVAHLALVKDQLTLLRCFSKISQQIHAELRIIGEDTINGSIQRLAAELGIASKVKFMTMMPYGQIQEQYNLADCLIHTSLYEGQSMAMTEAAASGVLVAGTRVGILHDLGEKCGIVVNVGDYNSLADEILKLWQDPVGWQSKIEEAHRWSLNHDLKWTISRFCEVLK